MKRLGWVLPEAVGSEEVMRAARARMALRRWEEVVGPMLATKSRPERWDRGTVWVAVEGSAWAQELRLLSGTILRKLRQISGDNELFTDLRFGVRPLPPLEVVEEAEELIPKQPEIEEMTIQEIAARRLAKMEPNTPPLQGERGPGE